MRAAGADNFVRIDSFVCRPELRRCGRDRRTRQRVPQLTKVLHRDSQWLRSGVENLKRGEFVSILFNPLAEVLHAALCFFERGCIETTVERLIDAVPVD